MTREKMIEELIESQWESYDLKDLYWFVRNTLERDYAECSDDAITAEYNDIFGDDD